jgi:hypothetical protein
LVEKSPRNARGLFHVLAVERRLAMTDVVMHPGQKAWPEFCKLLNEQLDKHGCKGGRNKDLAIAVLEDRWQTLEREACLAFFESFGGYCDCEILYNVGHGWDGAVEATVLDLRKKALHDVSNLKDAIDATDIKAAMDILRCFSSLLGNLQICEERHRIRLELQDAS